MPCYARAAAALVVIGVVVTAAWLHLGTALPAGLIITIAAAATLALLGWTARVIRRGRAQQGHCTGCRLPCQQAQVPADVRDPVLLPWPHAGQLTIREKA